MKVGWFLHTPLKITGSPVSSFNFILPSIPFRPHSVRFCHFRGPDRWDRSGQMSTLPFLNYSHESHPPEPDAALPPHPASRPPLREISRTLDAVPIPSCAARRRRRLPPRGSAAACHLQGAAHLAAGGIRRLHAAGEGARLPPPGSAAGTCKPAPPLSGLTVSQGWVLGAPWLGAGAGARRAMAWAVGAGCAMAAGWGWGAGGWGLGAGSSLGGRALGQGAGGWGQGAGGRGLGARGWAVLCCRLFTM